MPIKISLNIKHKAWQGDIKSCKQQWNVTVWKLFNCLKRCNNDFNNNSHHIPYVYLLNTNFSYKIVIHMKNKFLTILHAHALFGHIKQLLVSLSVDTPQ